MLRRLLCASSVVAALLSSGCATPCPMGPCLSGLCGCGSQFFQDNAPWLDACCGVCTQGIVAACGSRASASPVEEGPAAEPPVVVTVDGVMPY